MTDDRLAAAGSPWACAWTAVRLWTHHTLALVGDGEDGSYQQID